MEDVRTLCHYCELYSKVAKDYPLNFGIHQADNMVERCSIHFQYICDKCNSSVHFNGISWCNKCKLFICLNCAKEKLIHKNFLIYTTYYMIACSGCGNDNPSLDFAEFNLSHPIQVGEIRPEPGTSIWVPLEEPSHKPVNFKSMLIGNMKYEVYVGDDSSVEVWNRLADQWSDEQGDDGDISHNYVIHPAVLEVLEVSEGDKVLDFACGTGTLSRKIRRSGAEVWGVDPSDMIDSAISKERENPLSIIYTKEYLDVRSKPNFFDKVVCNMAFMDIKEIDEVLNGINEVLKPGGVFVFSITHPCFNVPTISFVKIPSDSQRNEDRILIVDKYLPERTVRVKYHDLGEPMLYYHRTISTYINLLVKHGFKVLKMVEPQPSEEVVNERPRDFYLEHSLAPRFLVIKALKEFI